VTTRGALKRAQAAGVRISAKRRMKTLVSRPKPVLGLCKTILGSGSREFPRLRFNAFEPASTLSGQNKMAEISDCGSVIYHYANRGSGRNWLVSRAAIS